MFSRIKDALDRTLAEEQARHKASTGQKDNAGEVVTPSTLKAKSPVQADAANPDATNPDPAVFEAAFKLDDEADGASRAGTPKPADTGEVNGGNDSTNSQKKDPAQPQDIDVNKAASADTPDKSGDPARASSKQPPQYEPSADVRAKLKRLARLEPSYLELLRSYRIAHSRITPFERTLQEHTPLDSIKDPKAFVEYLNQINSKSDMIVQELKRVSIEKDDFKKKCEESDKELASLRDELCRLRLVKVDGAGTESKGEKGHKPAEKEDEGGDIFSYEDELTKLQAELDAKTEEIEKLTAKLDKANKILAAEPNSTSADEGSEQVAEQPVGYAAAAKVDINAMDAEIVSLKEDLADKEKTIQEMVAELAKTTSLLTTAQAEKDSIASKLAEESRQMSERLTSMSNEVEIHKKAVAAKTNGAQTIAKASPASTAASPSAVGTGKKNKNKNKKKKGGALQPEVESAPSEVSELAVPLDSPDTAALMANISQLQKDIATKDEQIEKLSKKRKTEEELREKLAYMEDNLIDIGQMHVTAKEDIKKLESEKITLQTRISELEGELEAAKAGAGTANQQMAEFKTMEKEFEELKIQFRARESELGAATSLAQDRFKELKRREEILAKAQAEMKSLRQDSTALKTTREELVSAQASMRALEKQEATLKNEVNRIQRLSTDRESEIKLLNKRLSAEKVNFAKLEDEKRVAGRGYRRAEAEKVEIAAKAEKTGFELEKAQAELADLRPRVKQLEEEAAALRKANNVAKEDVDFKTQQYNSAESLVASMRDQITELSMQRKEAQTKAEGLEEELAESQRHLAERTRETEAMRRMLTQQGDQAETQVREMRSRVEAATEERDRIEEESLTLARRRAREAEELKNRLRELEREVKALGLERDNLEAREKEWRRRREELEQIEEKATAEMEAMQSTVSGLRSALDVSEQQVRDAEKREAHTKKLLNDAKAQAEKANKDLLEAARSRGNIASSPHVAASGRTSAESTRSSTTLARSINSGNGAETAYVKTIFLQFLEVKDDKLRSQLIPVLGRILGFDKQEEERGLKAVQHLQKPGRS